MELNAWSRDLTVEVAGHGVVSHTGSAMLRLLADGTGLTGGLSKALRRPGFHPVHDRGRVLADTAVLIADGGTVMSDLATLRDQGELFGPVASDLKRPGFRALLSLCVRPGQPGRSQRSSRLRLRPVGCGRGGA